MCSRMSHLVYRSGLVENRSCCVEVFGFETEALWTMRPMRVVTNYDPTDLFYFCMSLHATLLDTTIYYG